MKVFLEFVAFLLCFSCIGAAECQGQWTIAESIPVDLQVSTLNTTYETWMTLLQSAKQKIRLAAFYMTLSGGKNFPEHDGGYMGYNVYQEFFKAKARGVDIEIVINSPTAAFPDTDTETLKQKGIADVRYVNWTALPKLGGGILHTKLFVVDGRHAYMGSANMDWRSLAQVKELGLAVENCPIVAEDIEKIFETYWLAAEDNRAPQPWPKSVDTIYNKENPIKANLNGVDMDLFVAADPKIFDPPTRTEDEKALVGAIDAAQKYVNVEVMDYSPTSFYMNPNIYWPNIDDAFRRAAFRGVNVQLLFAKWPYTVNATIPYIQSLNEVANITVRWYEVPHMPPPNVYIPYTRVNHAKFMVTDKVAYIGTSNWVADYFINTAGASTNILGGPIHTHLKDIFDRDWNSKYWKPVEC